MQTRKLGNELEVFPVGLGCMGMSFVYGGQPEAEAIATLRRAVEIGVLEDLAARARRHAVPAPLLEATLVRVRRTGSR